VRARGGELARDLREGGCAGEEGRKEKGALTRGPGLAARGKRGADARAGEEGNGPAWPMRGNGKRGGKRWASGKLGPGGKRGPVRGRGRRFGLG
jgi:hypothetical protein